MSASLVVLFLCLLVSLKSQVLMAEFPNKLIFYDEFEQKIDKPTFASYTPFKVIKRNTTLSDKLTSCISVEFEKSQYFILKNEKKSLVNYKKAGVIQLFQKENIKIEKIFLSEAVNYSSNINLKEVSGKIPSGNYISFLERDKHHLIQYGDHKFVWVKRSQLKKKQNKSVVKEQKSNVRNILLDIITETNTLYTKHQLIYTKSTSPVWEKKDEQYQLISNDIEFKQKLFKEFVQYIEKKGLSEYIEFDDNLFSARAL